MSTSLTQSVAFVIDYKCDCIADNDGAIVAPAITVSVFTTSKVDLVKNECEFELLVVSVDEFDSRLNRFYSAGSVNTTS